MSGYLQRLALGARQPGGAIQPVLGSVFGPPPSSSGLEEETGDSRRQAPGIAAPLAPAPVIRSRQPEPEGPVSRGAEAAPARSEVQAPLFAEPLARAALAELASESPARESPASAPAPMEEDPSRSFAPLFSRPMAGADAPSGPDAPSAPARKREAFPPPEEPAERRPEAAPELAALAHFGAVRSRPPHPFAARVEGKEKAAAPRARPEPREPDEIQIHIGRIEVIAVPAAPARPAPPKPRREPSRLDEYLRRRDGGAA
jgi:hypothetical protein